MPSTRRSVAYRPTPTTYDRIRRYADQHEMPVAAAVNALVLAALREADRKEGKDR